MIKRFALPSTLALLFSGAAFADTVAAPETKKAAELGDDRRHRGDDRGVVGDVGDDGEGALGGVRDVAVEHGDVRAVGEEPPRDRRAADGHVFALRQVAAVTTVVGQPEITRENLRRTVAVTGRLSGRDLGSTVRDVQATLRQPGLLPRDVTFVLGGAYAQQQTAFAGLLLVLGAAGGCLVGRHMANKKAKQDAAARAQDQSNAQAQRTTPAASSPQ